MLNGSDQVLSEMEKLSMITSEINRAMSSISDSSVKVSASMEEVQNAVQDNIESTASLADKTSFFVLK